MEKIILDNLKRFMLTPAPSGYEKEMAYGFKDIMLAYTNNIEIDNTGNVIAFFEGRDRSAPKVMIYAHMDQLGFMVRKIEGNGYIQVDRLGGIPEKVLPGLNIVIRNIKGEYIPAVFGMKSHHATLPEEKYKVDQVTSLFLDIGARSKDEVFKAGIRPGCPAIYEPVFRRLCSDLVSGTAVDNRGGVAALTGIASILAKEKPMSDVYVVGTVWEEFNLRGAIMAARAIKPDIAICLDVVLSGDTPDLSSKYDISLGRGPAVMMYSFHGRGTLNGTIPHEGLVKKAHAAADSCGIKLQIFSSLGLLTDSAYVQLENSGAACLEMGFPARYTHTPVEICSCKDIAALSITAAELVSGFDSTFDIKRY